MTSDSPALPRPSPRRPRPLWRRWSEFILGLLLMILAPLVGGPLLPGPFGFLGFALGLALVLRSSLRAKRHYARFKRRWPHWAGWTEWGLRRGPRPALSKAAKHDRQQRKQAESQDRQQNGRIRENAA